MEARWHAPRLFDASHALYFRIVTRKEQKLFVEMFPALSTELERLLAERGEPGLAAQVTKLSVIERCRCGDDFCGTFYVLPNPPEHTARAIGMCPSNLREAC
jgi:hypothetical protein